MRVELALSLAGHDKGHYYVVVGEEAEAVYVADGELKLLARPKRKNRRHIQPIRKLPADVAELLQNQMDDVSGRIRERSSGTCTYQRKTADKFYPYFTGRSGEGCTFPI